ncbi:transcription factor bHLH95 [Coffea eugenioides]|uniref:Transcription factor bHLH95-like n=1 Tax=Coffea arabica TaxID=13443 RepID=A0ABM4WUX0_COFAR|nr:transcription factor bHLH95 [Coffea eugenioides]
MSEGGSHDNFLWDNEVWALSNSDNSGRSDENQPAKKFSESNNSNCPTPREAEPGVGPSLGKRKRKNGKQPSVEGNDQAAEGKGSAGADHELHIWTERERRKKMRSMFSNLQSLLPQLPPKADKSTIVDEAVNYIRSLQQTLQRLQKQKLEMIRGLTTINYDPSMITPHRLAMDSREAFLADQGSSSQLSSNPNPLGVARFPTSFRTWATPNMVLNVCGDKAHINICCPKKLGLFSAICYFLEKHKLEVVSAHVSSDNYRSLYMIQAQALDHQYPEAFSFDDIFHLATGEMMMYMSSL